MTDGDPQPALPFRLTDFLSGAYYALAITGILIGLVVYVVTMHTQVIGILEREKDHPSKAELAAAAVKIDAEILALQNELKQDRQHLDDLDTHGTRALSDRITALEQYQRQQDDRTVSNDKSTNDRVSEVVRRLNDMQTDHNKMNDLVSQIKERQSVNNDIIRQLQDRLFTYSGGERGPTAPQRMPRLP